MALPNALCIVGLLIVVTALCGDRWLPQGQLGAADIDFRRHRLRLAALDVGASAQEPESAISLSERCLAGAALI